MASTITNIGYNSIAKVLTLGIGIFTSAILARKLDSTDYGLVGVAMVVIGFLSQFSDPGITTALIQRKTLNQTLLETAHGLNLIFAVGMFIIALASAPLCAVLFDNPKVTPIVMVLSSTYLIGMVGFLPSVMLTREMSFGKLRLPSVSAALVRGLGGVALAMMGWKYWSLVYGSIAASVIRALLLRTMRPTPVKWRINRSAAMELLRFGTPVWLAGLISFGALNIDKFMIGSIRGAAQLGFYTVALTWATYGCSAINEIVHSVLFPRFSQMQGNRAELAVAYMRSLRAVAFLATMANACLFAVARSFLVVVLGKGDPKWLPALLPLQILCLYGVFRAGTEPVANVIVALGKPKLMLWSALIPIVLQASLLPIVAIKWGLPGICWLVAAAYCSQWVIYTPFISRELGIGPRALLGVLFPVGAAAAVAVIGAGALPLGQDTSWLAIFIKGSACALLFVATHELLTRGAMTSEVTKALKTRSNKAKQT